MTTTQLVNNTLSAEATQWVMDKYKAVDARDHDAYAAFLADDCKLQFGNNPVVAGEAAMLAGVDNFWHSIHGLNHNFINMLGSDDLMVLEAMIDYTRADDKVVAIPCVTIIERNKAGEASFIRIFIDLLPVFA